MIEQMARAMQAVSRPSISPDQLTPGPRGSVGLMPVWKLYEPMARAALEAMRELTPEMIAVGEQAAWDDANHMPAFKAVPTAWSAMIEHASKGEPTCHPPRPCNRSKSPRRFPDA